MNAVSSDRAGGASAPPIPHPADVRARLERVGAALIMARDLHVGAMAELGYFAQLAVDAGVSVSDVARLARVTRRTVYASLRRGSSLGS